jgi:ABC-type Mn2+/Zn2+ transport system ATPase subunit
VALDAQMRVFLCEWVGELRDAGAALIVATHELEPFAGMVDAVIAVEEGVGGTHPMPQGADTARRRALLAALATRHHGGGGKS